MGGAAGHMAHPYNLPQVKTGKDLIKFFDDAAGYLNKNAAAVKIDGTNVSIKLVDGINGKEFAADRGSFNSLDLEGVTVSKLGERFPAGHGLLKHFNTILTIFNEGLPKIKKELKELGMWDNPTIFLNSEYVTSKVNVTQYEENFLALHGLNQFYNRIHARSGVERPGLMRPEGVDSKSTEIPYSKSAIKSIIRKLNPIAENHNFKVYGSIPTQLISDISYDTTLSKNFPIKFSEGDVINKTLEQWLSEAINPNYTFVKLSNGKKLSSLGKLIYLNVEKGVPLDSFIENGDDVRNAMYGAVFNHATRMLGNDILNALTSDMGSVSKHEGIVLRDDKLFGPNPVKITGEFLVKGMQSDFQTQTMGESSIEDMEAEEDNTFNSLDIQNGRVIALIAGKYKPPHKGHLQMIQHYSEVVKKLGGSQGKVIVLVSPLSVPVPNTEEVVSWDDSLEIWKLYLQDAGIHNVEVQKSQFNSPVEASFVFASEIAEHGDSIILGSSSKGGDQKRFASNVQKYAGEGVKIYDPMPYIFKPSGYENVLNATDFRHALGTDNNISMFLPDTSAHREQDIKNIIFEDEKKTLTLESLYSLVEEAFDSALNEVSSELQQEESLSDEFKKYYPGLKKALSLGISFIKGLFPGTEEDTQRWIDLHNELAESHPWYPTYIDPIKDPQKLVDTLEVLSDFSTKDNAYFIEERWDKWIQAVTLGLDEPGTDYAIFKEWYIKQYIPNVIMPELRKAQDQKIADKAKYNEREKQFKDTGSARLPGEESYMDRVYRIAKEKGLTPEEVMGFLEEQEINETSGAGAVAGSPGLNKGPWIGLDKVKDREDLTISNR